MASIPSLEHASTEPTNRLKHFVLFSFITVCLIFFIQFIAQNINRGTLGFGIINMFALVEFQLMSIIVFRTYRTRLKLNYLSKVVFMAGLIFVNLATVTIIAIINPFNRIITDVDMSQGAITTVIGAAIMLILCLPVLAFVKNKIIDTN